MNELKSPTRSFLDCRSDIARDGTVAKSGAAKNNEIDPLLHPGRVAKILDVSPSWLAKARMNGTGPASSRSAGRSATPSRRSASSS
jgi:hypothetical protein